MDKILQAQTILFLTSIFTGVVMGASVGTIQECWRNRKKASMAGAEEEGERKR